MRPPRAAHELVTPCLDLLRKKIRERSFSELEVEKALGWQANHIRLLTFGMKGLHVEEVLKILAVIGVEPEEFFIELYGPPPSPELHRQLARLSAQVNHLADLLVEKQVVTASELARAVAMRAGGPDPTLKQGA